MQKYIFYKWPFCRIAVYEIIMQNYMLFLCANNKIKQIKLKEIHWKGASEKSNNINHLNQRCKRPSQIKLQLIIQAIK